MGRWSVGGTLDGRRQKEEMEDVAVNSDRDLVGRKRGKEDAAEASKAIINNKRHKTHLMLCV